MCYKPDWKTMLGGRIEHRFSSKCGFHFRAKTSKFPCILVNCPNFPKPSPSCSHSRGLTSPQSPAFPGSGDIPCPQTLVEVLLTAWPPRMSRENAAWLTKRFGNTLLAVFEALYQVFLTLYWLGPWRAQLSKVEVNNFTPESHLPGPRSSLSRDIPEPWRQPRL